MAKIHAVIRKLGEMFRISAASAALILCSGCVLFPASRSYELIELAALRDSKDSGFSTDPGEAMVLRSDDNSARVTAIQECDIDIPTPPLSRTRQLFVGFKEVRLPVASMLEIDGVPVQRTAISANLDEVPLSVVDYSFRNQECAFDIVLWTAEESGPNVPNPAFEQSKKQLEAYLPQIVPGLMR